MSRRERLAEIDFAKEVFRARRTRHDSLFAPGHAPTRTPGTFSSPTATDYPGPRWNDVSLTTYTTTPPSKTIRFLALRTSALHMLCFPTDLVTSSP
eukprot:8674052-Pyramimonas_sp.AAC.1